MIENKMFCNLKLNVFQIAPSIAWRIALQSGQFICFSVV